ncbi:hypothetical protein NVIRENTERO_00195 [Sodalis praecaptivus]|nr:alpha/beta hydrolase [Sodalis praecaptivus]CAJ0991106.1 hypothetical protein NVIRENTERO_00195 [Sodalis praecaptivus]
MAIIKRLTQLANSVFCGVFSLSKKMIIGILILLAVFFIGRVYESQQGPALHRWHTWVPDEMTAANIDKATFAEYLAKEDALFRAMKANVTDKITPEEATPLNRYYAGSLVYPGKFARDWNRSYVLMPAGQPRGAVVVLHGLTDTPYSLKSIAEDYQQQGFVAVAPRLPVHGTVPTALTSVDWEDWLAATRLAVREATRLAGPTMPLHLVGFSNGGALAMKYSLDSLDDNRLRKPQQIILLSPMIGVTAFARFAGLAGRPSIFPAFAKAAWLGIVPEFNPFKYNSFPVKAARQSYLLTQALQRQIIQDARSHKLDELPPVLTFQSVMDSTVSSRAVVQSLYNHKDNGSELVIFDINQAVSFRPLFRRSSWTVAATLLPARPRRYTTSVITNASESALDTVARITPAGQEKEIIEPLNIRYPPEMYSLSHVALPFPVSDSLYGSQPADEKQYGISFGTLSMRGESSALIVGLESLMRATSNPFFPYLLERINHNIACSHQSDVVQCLRSL